MAFETIVNGYRKNISQTVLGLKIAMAYKFEFLIGLVSTPISLFIYYFLWKAIFAYTGVELIRGFTFDALINYFVLSMLIGFFAWSDIDAWMERAIIHGDMISDLVRPLSYIKLQLFFELGLKVMALVTQAIPLVIGAHLILGLVFVTWKLTVLALISLVMASVLYFLITYIIGMSAFWLKRISGLRRVKRGLILLLSGGLLPLSFFPPWYANLSHYLPFEHIRYTTIKVYLGQYSASAAGFENLFVSLGMQLVWIVILFMIAQGMWNIAFRRFAGAGA